MTFTWPMLKKTFANWSEDRVPRLSAALAFYTMLSIAPLLIICMKILTTFVSREKAQEQISTYAGQTVGATGAQAISQMIDSGAQPGAGVIAAIVSTVILFFSASGVFGELQSSMNTIWEVKPRSDRGWWGVIMDRFLSFTLVLGVAFLLLVSLVISTVLSALSAGFLPGANWLWQAVNIVVSLAVVAGLFALMFKYLPDVKIEWRDVWFGAIVTAVLFTVGKYLLGLYLSRGSTVSIYGAAGSLVALLLWVYYSAQIVFFGAEMTQVHARGRGAAIVPAVNAVPIDESDRAEQGIPTRPPQQPAARPMLPAAPAAVKPRFALSRALPPSLRPARAYAASDQSAGGGSRLLPLLMGVAIGKLILGRRSKPGRRHFAPVKAVQPGWSSRQEHERQREYVLRIKPPKAVQKVVDKVQEGYEAVKDRFLVGSGR